MSNVYRFAPHVVHFQVPQAVIPKLTYLRSEELRLLLFLQSEFQRTNRSVISLGAGSISAATGIHPTNLGSARNGLISEGLLIAEREGKSYRYGLCDPTDRSLVPDGGKRSAFMDFDSLSADVLLRYFRGHLRSPKRTENGLSSTCPFPDHLDRTPSFSAEIKDGGGGRWNCFGCSRGGKLVDFEIALSGGILGRQEAHRAITERLRMLGVQGSACDSSKDVVYAYTDELGEVISETVRPGGHKVGMYRRRPHPSRPHEYINDARGCRNLLYQLPEIVEADTVIVVEGEPDVERLRSLHLQDVTGWPVAVTTKAGGAGGWREEHSFALRGKWVVLIGDNDADGKGLRHMIEVGKCIDGIAKEIRLVELPSEYRDASHFLESHSADDLITLIGEDWFTRATQA